MEPRRGYGSGETLILACGGAAHCGQVAYRSAIELAERRVGRAYCIAAVAAGIEEKVERCRRACRRVAIDGCEDHCARKTLERFRLPVDLHIVVSDFGVERRPVRPSLIRDSRMIVEQVRLALPVAIGR